MVPATEKRPDFRGKTTFVTIRFESIRVFMTLYLYYVSPSDFKTRGCRTGQDVTLGPERALGSTRRRKKGGREGGGGGEGETAGESGSGTLERHTPRSANRVIHGNPRLDSKAIGSAMLPRCGCNASVPTNALKTDQSLPGCRAVFTRAHVPLRRSCVIDIPVSPATEAVFQHPESGEARHPSLAFPCRERLRQHTPWSLLP